MEKVWKVGSRWGGCKNNSLLSIFRRNNVVFVGPEKAKERFLSNVKKGHYIAITDGYQIVSIAKAIGNPDKLENLKNIEITANDFGFDYKNYKDVVGVKVSIVEIEKSDYKQFKCKRQGTFFALNEELGKSLVHYYDAQDNRFAINAYTATLLGSDKGEYRSLLDKHTRYIIPVYQRPYAWSEKEIVPFVTDIVNAYLGEKTDAGQSEPEPMFIGTMQLSRKKYITSTEYEQDVIDGQQRITTLTLLLFELRKQYPDCRVLQDMDFKWLETHINKEQSAYLTDYLNQKEGVQLSELNKYYTNSLIIRNAFHEALPDEDYVLNIDAFCEFLTHKVYFVIIETTAGLSKTIQIFNTINNTGLDLNGGDLFKVRMYEYLTDCQSEDESVFEKINALYQQVDSLNKEKGKTITTMSGVLAIYKNVLITKYQLPTDLYDMGWETFYSRLFDTLLGIKDWRDSFAKVTPSLEEIDNVIKLRYAYEEMYPTLNVEAQFALRHINGSRYNRYKGIVLYMFLFFRQNSKNVLERGTLEQLLVAMDKLFFAYSVLYDKRVRDMQNFVTKEVQKIGNNPSYDIEAAFKKKLSSVRANVEIKLQGYISDNMKRKNLICQLSTYLSEKDSCPTEVIKHIFETPFDVEHIHANADEAVKLDSVLQNSIGNLCQLEQSFNRSIKDEPFCKKREVYQKSCYVAMKKIAKLSQWNTKEAEDRRTTEVKNMMTYLFGE